MIPKRYEVDARWWLAEIRSMPCVVCGKPRSDPHHLYHIRWRDDYAVNLCRGCHRSRHDAADKIQWEQTNGVDLAHHLLKFLTPLFEKRCAERGILFTFE